MRQTLWAEQVIDNKSSEKIKADSFVHIHVVPSQNKELLDNGFSREKEKDGMKKSWENQLLDKGMYGLVDPQLIVETIAKDGKYGDLVGYLRERYGWKNNKLLLPKNLIKNPPLKDEGT